MLWGAGGWDRDTAGFTLGISCLCGTACSPAGWQEVWEFWALEAYILFKACWCAGKAQQGPQTWEAPNVQAMFTCWERSHCHGQQEDKLSSRKFLERTSEELSPIPPLGRSPCPTWQPAGEGWP